MSEGGRIVYAPIVAAAIGADATIDVWNLLGTSAIRIRLLGFELTSAAVAAALTTLTLGFVSTAGTGGSAVTEQHADDAKTTTILGALVTDVETPGTDAGRFMGFQWEQLGPVGHIWTPEMAPICAAAEGFSLVQTTAIAMTVSGFVCWEEIYV